MSKTQNGSGRRGARDPSVPASADAAPAASVPPPSVLAEFAATRAHDVIDTLHGEAKARIDQAQGLVNEWRLDQIWAQAQPLLRRGAAFVRDYPLRAASIVALLAGAFLLTRLPDATATSRST
jgi:ElaB/YqjD/DUF883 family membrane-anchored ribosome-binding protein